VGLLVGRGVHHRGATQGAALGAFDIASGGAISNAVLYAHALRTDSTGGAIVRWDAEPWREDGSNAHLFLRR